MLHFGEISGLQHCTGHFKAPDHKGNVHSQTKKTSRPVVGTKPLQKPGQSYLPPSSVLCGPYFLSAKNTSSLERGGVCFLLTERAARAGSKGMHTAQNIFPPTPNPLFQSLHTYMCVYIYMSGGAKYLPKLLPISFSGVYLVLYVFRGIWPSNRENPSVYWHATLSCPSWPQIMQICMSFRSRSDLVLDDDHALDYFLSDLAFQARISFYSVFDKSGT